MTVHVSKLFGFLPATAKAAIVLLVTLGAVVHLVSSGYADWRAGADTFYVMVLLFVFFSRERDDDERVRELKLRALMVAFVSGWAFAGAFRFASYLQDRDAVPKVPSAYDAMFVVLVVANAVYLLWHHRDGRDAAARPGV
jgi:hypothetical protein